MKPIIKIKELLRVINSHIIKRSNYAQYLGDLQDEFALLANSPHYSDVRSLIIQGANTSESIHELKNIVTESIFDDTVTEVCFCTPLKTWGYKTDEHLFSFVHFRKYDELNMFIRKLENYSSIFENIKSTFNFKNLVISDNVPKLVASQLLHLEGELSEAPRHFALFFPEYLDKNPFTIEANVVTLYFPEIYLERHLSYRDRQQFLNYTASDSELLLFLTIWFKGHEFGHYLRNSQHYNFWNNVRKKFTPRELGALEELLADLFGLEFSFRQPEVKAGISRFVEIYFLELNIYSSRVSTNTTMWFEDTDSANIQVNYFSNLAKNQDADYIEYFIRNPEAFINAVNVLFKEVFTALVTTESDSGNNYLRTLLTHKTLKYETKTV